MQLASSIRYAGLLVKATDCNYEDCKNLGLVCPNCHESVFLIQRHDCHYKSSKTSVVAEEARTVPVVDTSAMCACLAAQTMILAQRQEDLQKFGEDGVGHSSTIYAAIEAAFEVGGEEWANQVAIAIRDKFFQLM